MLSLDLFKTVTAHVPLVAIDLLITIDDSLLVGLRNNEPAKSTLFVPGGRIYKGEKFGCAIDRILTSELRTLQLPISSVDFNFFGLYEHFYENSFFSDETFSTHYIVLAFLLVTKVDSFLVSNLSDSSDQHASFFLISGLSPKPDLDLVHPYTQAYLNALEL